MRIRRFLAPLVALAALAGLGGLPGIPGVPAKAGATAPYFPLAEVPAPAVTGAEMATALEGFVADHPYRVTGTPTNILAAKFIEQDLKGLGYQTAIVDLPAVNGQPVTQPVIQTVTATKPGTGKADETIMFIAHYDTVPQTITGTYDNGTGVTMLRYLARSLRDVPTNRTITFAFYNGEEEGTLASDRHAELLKASGAKITAVLGFDMVGIAWPVAAPKTGNCLCMWHGANDGKFKKMLEHVNFTYLGFPKGSTLVDVVGVNNRNSDEASYASRGFPTLRWAGMRRAADYTAYHLPDDNMDTIVTLAGGRAFFEDGLQNTLKSAYYSALQLDNHLPSGLGITRSGSTFTATAADADGELTGFSWDFGDGTTATGSSVEHMYTTPGTYNVALTVADNRWPGATVTKQQTFTAP